MYLSRLELNTRVKEVRRDIADLYEMHSTLKRAFANSSDMSFLWRIEKIQLRYPTILVQSMAKPSWTDIVVQNYFVHYEFKEYNIANHLEERRHFRFRLEANPIVKKCGKRRAILETHEQMNWMKSKADKCGFSLSALTIERPHLVSMVKRKTGDLIQLHSVLFEGVLSVIDRTKFLKALEGGIGPAKAFGFGLLSIGRV